MGPHVKGWPEARKAIMKENIGKDYDLVFLQEVPWNDDHLIQYLDLSTPVQYRVAGNIWKSRSCRILYKSTKLQECKTECDKVAATVRETVENWEDNYSEGVCIHTFTLKGKGGLTKFVAISLHAPKDASSNKPFLDCVRRLIGKVVDGYKLPVLVGGDFNTDEIDDWEDNGFIGLNHKTERRRIDYITMKVPEYNNYLQLEMAEVEQMRFDHIVIPETAQGLKVKKKSKDKKTVKVQILKSKDQYKFFGLLCEHHMPLTVVLTCHSYIDQPPKPTGEHERGIPVKREVARADDKSTLQEMVHSIQEEIEDLELKSEEAVRYHREMYQRINTLEIEKHQLEEKIKELHLKGQSRV